jgi:hypothetical protein
MLITADRVPKVGSARLRRATVELPDAMGPVGWCRMASARLDGQGTRTPSTALRSEIVALPLPDRPFDLVRGQIVGHCAVEEPWQLGV